MDEEPARPGGQADPRVRDAGVRQPGAGHGAYRERTGSAGTLVAPPRGFPRAEHDARLERAQRLMREAGLDALLLTSEADVRYFSGFLTPFWLSPTRPWFLVVPARARPVAVIPAIGAPLMRRTWIGDIRTWPSPRPEDEGVSLLADTLRSVAVETGRIGVPRGAETVLRMPLDDYRRLRASLPRVEVADAAPLLRTLRMVKSEAELAKIAHACAVAAVAFDALPSLVRRGRSLADVARDFRIALLAAGADEVPYLVGGAGAGGYEDVIAPPDDLPLRGGDVLMLDAGAVYDGYFCDFDRNVAVARVDDRTRRAHGTLHEATEAGIRAARPGVTCAEVFRAMHTVLERAGYACDVTGRMGHGVGMRLTEWPSVREGDGTVLAPGMAITLEPALTLAPGRCMVHEEVVAIRDAGAELLTPRAPRELPVVG